MEPFMETQGILDALISLQTHFFPPKLINHERVYIAAINLNSVVC